MIFNRLQTLLNWSEMAKNSLFILSNKNHRHRNTYQTILLYYFCSRISCNVAINKFICQIQTLIILGYIQKNAGNKLNNTNRSNGQKI
ncbi:uncharacterized protein NEPG_00726 [Nematocida parisii ERTm1]|uniref:Uncharacterized protein n=1 Tax=Nematocida parisii (strain ERTm3) TaxID=935791 RepID=I3EKJ0_NEMP3|nr:uncharacterized protein NEPG_00726 [Nematocida parisii ERTm1]EIJ89737.1 hypothetical protein NEQG_00507 [Nematocida parisii ERTm3]EIJ94060.1 hypothetical protein NEPG_00726 [Nematocida parisii ERTm1]|eukprot:XP_013058556.1 hypothetical protein NEPG_00726 [Nematocida parisii ERTm1]